MTENLYLIIEGERKEVDLKTPSGIVFRFQSNLLNDLSKIDCSKTYTFKLPNTQNNIQLFDHIDDMRINSSMYGKRAKCEYWFDGIPIVQNGNLYISEINGRDISAVMTFGVIDGLIELNAKDMSIRSLDDSEVVMYGSNESAQTIRAGYFGASKYDNANVQTPLYEAGLKIETEDARLKSYKIKEDESGRSIRTIPFPPPVVPLYKILNAISSRYSLQFDSTLLSRCTYQQLSTTHTTDIAKVGGLPMVTMQSKDEYIGFEGVRDIYDARYYFTDRIEGEKTLIVLNAISYSRTVGDSDSMLIDYYEQTHQEGMPKSVKLLVDNANLKVDGRLEVIYTNKPDETPTLNLVYASLRGVTELVKVEAEYDEQNSSSRNGYRYIWDLREEEGHNNLTYSDYLPTNLPILLQVSQVPDTIVSGSFKFSPYFDEGITKRYCKVYAGLPDISCMTLLKSIYYMKGGFPKVSDDGKIGILLFTDIRDNITSGNVYDWSRYVVYDKDAKIITYTNGNIARENFYLMKNESIEYKETESTEDVYGGNRFAIETKNEVLDRQKTMYQFPFYGKFLVNGKRQSLETGETIKYWSISDNIASASEAKPAFGTFSIDYNAVLRFSVWEMDANEQYQYLQQILEKPIFCKINMKMPLLELIDIDYTKPVYIEQYNSLFAIISIEILTNGTSVSELIKL